MKNPLISIITVCYNSEKTIERTIQSVLAQTYTNIEYIIIDGASKDSTLSIINYYANKDSRIKLISEKDDGIYNAMNKGIKKSSGELIGIINSDDWYELDAVEKVVSNYLKLGDGVYYGFMKIFDINKNEISVERTHFNVLGDKMIQHPTCFLPLTLYKNFGLFNENYRSASDFDLLLNLRNKGIPFYPLDNIISNFSSGGISSGIIGAMESISIKRKFGYISKNKYLIKKANLILTDSFKKLLQYDK